VITAWPPAAITACGEADVRAVVYVDEDDRSAAGDAAIPVIVAMDRHAVQVVTADGGEQQ
jgi:hypothetical protein